MCQQYENEIGLYDLLMKSRRADCEKGNHSLAHQQIDTSKMRMIYGIRYVTHECRYCYKRVHLVLVPQEQTEHKDVYLPSY